ncbi:ExbD/TolR family protein [Aquirhabdus parva]|jgi:biopolymer transport protein ExbD|uniref:Biopolymer transporter ExbD n=1 Tax=Aquirhabdus parva TaxID=2283318 RepID=A0A345PA33_9GAMM|nr:biopolymer transporter ExbD [Aquirhabdus parva]AXI04142.1 biopolymer transporter ExbD [Aquirhabdus parva]
MRYLETKKARIEIIPMIDIMLFLLVFFAMMTLKMIPTSGHLTKLPTSSTAVTIPPTKLLVEITLDQDVVVENHTMTLPQLTALLKSRDSKKTVVTIAGDQNASLQTVMSVIDAVKQGGATEVALSASHAAPAP